MPTAPTKGNLIARKRSLELANTGFDLMDRKRNILIREIMSLIDRAGELQSRIDSCFSSAYKALQAANIAFGRIDPFAESVPIDRSIEIRTRSVMGVEIPSIRDSDAPVRMSYGLRGTGSALDEAFVRFHEVKRLTKELAEVENTIYRLAYAIKRTQKRANALKNIIIPNLTSEIKYISEELEEKEREEFSRLKLIKTRNESSR